MHLCRCQCIRFAASHDEGPSSLRRWVSDFAVWAHCSVEPRRRRSKAGLKSAITQADFSPQLASDLDRIYADLLPPRAFIAGTVSRAVMGPAQGDSEFVAHFSAERPWLHEAKMVRIGGNSPTYEAGLLRDKSEMLLVAVPSRLANREGALVDMFSLELAIRSRAPSFAAFVTRHGGLSCFFR